MLNHCPVIDILWKFQHRDLMFFRKLHQNFKQPSLLTRIPNIFYYKRTDCFLT